MEFALIMLMLTLPQFIRLDRMAHGFWVRNREIPESAHIKNIFLFTQKSFVAVVVVSDWH